MWGELHRKGTFLGTGGSKRARRDKLEGIGMKVLNQKNRATTRFHFRGVIREFWVRGNGKKTSKRSTITWGETQANPTLGTRNDRLGYFAQGVCIGGEQ